MAKMAKSIVSLKRELEAKQQEIAAAEEREAQRIGRLAVRAGLAELEIPDNDYLEVFVSLAARFRGHESEPTRRRSGKGSQAAISPA